MLSNPDAIQPDDPLPVSRKRFIRLPNNDCPTNFPGRILTHDSFLHTSAIDAETPIAKECACTIAGHTSALRPVCRHAEVDIRCRGSANTFCQLDVHKQQITYCILDRDGVTLREGEIVLTRERLTDFATKVLQPSDHAALESTTNCWAVVEVLQQHVANVVVSNPMATKAIAHSKINRRSWRKGPASPRGELVGDG